MNAFRKHIAQTLKESMLVSSEVQLVEPGGIERSLGKTKHVIDRRK